MKLVYICSPLRGDIEKNIVQANGYCRFASEQGVVPLAPHTIFTQFLDDRIEAQRQRGIDLGLELLKHCHELWSFGETVSDGMRAELEMANTLRIPIVNHDARCNRKERVNE